MLLIEYERANDAVAAGSGRGVAAVAGPKSPRIALQDVGCVI